MADDIAFKVEVPTDGGKSLLDLKKEFKELQKELSATKEGTKEYQLALQKLGAVKDDIGDLRDTINALNPEGKVAAFAKVGSTIASGFAAAQGAAALFGAESEELQKTMLKVQAAMALAEGIKGIAGAADAFKVLNTVMRANPIAAITLAFGALATASVAIYKHFQDINSVSSQMAREHEKLKESTASLTKSIDIQIQSLKGLKSNEDEILKLGEKKLKLNIELAKSNLQVALAKQFEAEQEFDYMEQSLRLSGKVEEAEKLKMIRTKEQRDATKLAIEGLKESIAGLSQFQNEEQQKTLDKTKEINDKSLSAHQKMLANKAAADKKENDEFAKRLKLTVQSQIENKARDKQAAIDAKKAENDALLASHIEGEENQLAASTVVANQKVKVNRMTEEQIRAEKQKTVDQNLAATKQGLQATQSLTDLYFAHQLKQSKGNAAAELAIRKKQFQVNKAFGIANAVIDGVGAVQKALNNPYPLNIVLAVISGLAAAVNIAKIASAKFDEGGGGGGSVDTGNIGATASAPAIPTPNNTATTISDSGQVEKAKTEGDKKVYVLEGDMTKTQKKQVNIEETAKI